MNKKQGKRERLIYEAQAKEDLKARENNRAARLITCEKDIRAIEVTDRIRAAQETIVEAIDDLRVDLEITRGVDLFPERDVVLNALDALIAAAGVDL
jgi:hypothetical protein